MEGKLRAWRHAVTCKAPFGHDGCITKTARLIEPGDALEAAEGAGREGVKIPPRPAAYISTMSFFLPSRGYEAILHSVSAKLRFWLTWLKKALLRNSTESKEYTSNMARFVPTKE